MAHTSIVAVDPAFDLRKTIRRYGSSMWRSRFLEIGDVIGTLDVSKVRSFATGSQEWIGSGETGSPEPDWLWYIRTDSSGAYVHVRIDEPEDEMLYENYVLASFNDPSKKITWISSFDKDGPSSLYPTIKDRYRRILTFRTPVTIVKSSDNFVNPWGTDTLGVVDMRKTIPGAIGYDEVNFRYGDGDPAIWIGDGDSDFPDRLWRWYLVWANNTIRVHFNRRSYEDHRFFDSTGPLADLMDADYSISWDSRTRVLSFTDDVYTVGSMSSGIKSSVWGAARAGHKKQFSMLDFNNIDWSSPVYYVKEGIGLTKDGWEWAKTISPARWEQAYEEYQQIAEIHDDDGNPMHNELSREYLESILNEIVIGNGKVVRSIRKVGGGLVNDWYDVVDTFLNEQYDRLYVDENHDVLEKDIDGKKNWADDVTLQELDDKYVADMEKDIIRSVGKTTFFNRERALTIKPFPGKTLKDRIYDYYITKTNFDNMYLPRLDPVIRSNDPVTRLEHDEMVPSPYPYDFTDQSPDWLNADTNNFPHYRIDEHGRLIQVGEEDYTRMITIWIEDDRFAVYKENGFDDREPTGLATEAEKKVWKDLKDAYDEIASKRTDARKEAYDAAFVTSKFLNRVQNYVDYHQQFIRYEGGEIAWPPKDPPAEVGKSGYKEYGDFISTFDEKYHDTLSYWMGFYLKFMRVDEGIVTYPNSRVLSDRYANPPLMNEEEAAQAAIDDGLERRPGEFNFRGRCDEYGFMTYDEEGYFSYCQDVIDSQFEEITGTNKKYSAEDASKQDIVAGPIDGIDQLDKVMSYVELEVRSHINGGGSDDNWARFTYHGKLTDPIDLPTTSKGMSASPEKLSFQIGDLSDEFDEANQPIPMWYPIPMMVTVTDPETGQPVQIENKYYPWLTDDKGNHIQNPNAPDGKLDTAVQLGSEVHDVPVGDITVLEFPTSSYVIGSKTRAAGTPLASSRWTYEPEGSNGRKHVFTIDSAHGMSYVIRMKIVWEKPQPSAMVANEDWDMSGLMSGYANDYLHVFLALDKRKWFGDPDHRSTWFQRIAIPNLYAPFDQFPYSTKQKFFDPTTRRFDSSTFESGVPFYQPGYGYRDGTRDEPNWPSKDPLSWPKWDEKDGYMNHRYHWPYWWNADGKLATGKRSNIYEMIGVTSNRVQDPIGDDKITPIHPRNRWDASSFPNPEWIVKKFTYEIPNPFYGEHLTEILGRIMTLQTYDFIFIPDDKAIRDQLTYDYPDNCREHLSNVTTYWASDGYWRWHFEALEDRREFDLATGTDINLGKNDWVGLRPLSYTYILKRTTPYGDANNVEWWTEGTPVSFNGKTLNNLLAEFKARYTRFRGGFRYFTGQYKAINPNKHFEGENESHESGMLEEWMFHDPAWHDVLALSSPRPPDLTVRSTQYWTDTRLGDTVLDRWERLNATAIEKVLNKGQHAVVVGISDELGIEALRDIKAREKALGINDWIPYPLG